MQNKTTLIIGSFDGLHIGHLLLFRKAKYPINVLLAYNIPSKNVNHIYDTNERIKQLLSLKIRNIFTYDVTNNNLTADDFIRKVIYKLNPSEIIVGDDFIFGSDRKRIQDCDINIPVILIKKNRNICSKLIKVFLMKNDIKKANKFLLFPYYSKGFVVHGNKIAKKIGFPTANISIDDDILFLQEGSYYGYVLVNNKKYKSVIFYGNSETFMEKKQKKIQAHILNFKKNIYHQQIYIYPISFIRPKQKFEMINDLVSKINDDIKIAYKKLK